MLRGENNERIRKFNHDKLSTYGLLKEFKELHIKDWTYQLINQGLIDQTEDEFPVLKLLDESWEILRNQRQVRLQRYVETKRARQSRSEEVSWEGVDRPLFEQLREWRKARAGSQGLAPYHILSDASLREVARRRPSTIEQLRLVYGIGDTKLREFGTELVEKIVDYCRGAGVSMDVPATTAKAAPRLERVTAGAEACFPLFRTGASIAEVSQKMGRALSTTVGYFCAFIQECRPQSISAWVDDDTRLQIIEAAKKIGTAFLKPIFIALEEKIPYDTIRIVLTHLETQEPTESA